MALVLVMIGCFCEVAAIISRAAFYRLDRNIVLSKMYYAFISLAVVGTMAGGAGFYLLAMSPVKPNVDYSQILSILSLLTAGITAGFFAFSYEKAPRDVVILPTSISICFVFLFYLMFGMTSFYLGQSSATHDLDYANITVTIIMWLLLVANVFFDFLDYRKHSNPLGN